LNRYVPIFAERRSEDRWGFFLRSLLSVLHVAALEALPVDTTSGEKNGQQ